MVKAAFAYVDGYDDIIINTVSDTPRAVMVNTILMASYGHVVPKADWDEAKIDRAFLNATGGIGSVQPVTVKECE